MEKAWKNGEKKNEEKNWNLELWTDIKWVRFGRTELSISGSDAEFWDLSFEKGLRLPGSHPDRKKVEKLFEKLIFSSCWRFFVTKSVGLRFYELSLSGSDAEFWDLSFEMGPKLSGSHPDGKKVEKLFEKLNCSSFWHFFVTKSVGLRFYELSLSVSDAEFWDLSFAMGPGAWFF